MVIPLELDIDVQTVIIVIPDSFHSNIKKKKTIQNTDWEFSRIIIYDKHKMIQHQRIVLDDSWLYIDRIFSLCP